MVFKMKTSRNGAGKPSGSGDKLSIAAAPYQVKFKNGKSRFYGTLREIYATVSKSSVESVFDRHEKSYLDTEILWKSRRRKFIGESSSADSIRYHLPSRSAGR
jgi:hypothetical protein